MMHDDGLSATTTYCKFVLGQLKQCLRERVSRKKGGRFNTEILWDSTEVEVYE